MTKILSTIPLFCLSFFSFAQHTQNNLSLTASNSQKSSSGYTWKTIPFENKVFIENKGQFDRKNNSAENDIIYGISNLGAQYYFTASGWTFRYDARKELTEDEIKSISHAKANGEAENEELESRVKNKSVPLFVHMKWVGANPNVQLVASDPLNHYFNYSYLDTDPGKTIKANAWKKITYRNIYPGIDIEYIFPEKKEGIKYTLIIHPGADPSVIKMHYEQTEGLNMDEAGNIHIKTAIGDLVDHAPITKYEDGTPLKSRFQIKDNTVTFKVSNLRASQRLDQDIIIDPWTTDPTTAIFNYYDAGYDVDYDNAGNVYVYGGGYPFTVIKYNSAGAILWYNSLYFYDSGCSFGNACYGDFAVDASSQSCYLVEAFNYDDWNLVILGARVGKLNQAGTLIAQWTPGFDARISEMWRISFNNCTKQAIIAGGGISQTYQACILDTTLTSMTPVNVLSATTPYHDFSLLAIDNYSNCFMASAKKSTEPAVLNNVMVKCPASTLVPVAYMVSDNHSFAEVASVPYVEGTSYLTNGFNGMAVNSDYVYTYDGSLLQKWNKNAGTLVTSRNLGGTKYASGGIDIDDCDSVFIGFGTSILKLNPTTLATVSTIQTFSNNIYDIKLGPGNMLYATGRKFVASISLPNTCGSLNLTTVSTPDSCASKGTATVTPLNGVGPYTYLWSPSGKTTSSITGLAAGSYTVTVNDQAFSPCSRSTGGSQTTTVTVVSSGSVTATSSASSSLCSGQSTTINASGGGTYFWSPGGSTTSSISVSPSSTTTYTVTVTGASSCTSTATTTITVNSVTAGSSAPTSICSGQSITITASGGNTYSWSPGGATTSSLTVMPAGTTTYTVTVTGAGGCTSTATTTITVNTTPPAPTITKSTNGDTLFCSFNAAYSSYQWFRNTLMMAGKTQNYLVIGTDTADYTVTVTSSNGCTNTASFSNRNLPVELLSFSASYNGKDVDLNWTTSAEINNDFFTVEKTKDGYEFADVTNVKGAGNSTILRNYYAVDEAPYPGLSAYRLKQTDFDGKFQYSRMVAVMIKANGKLNIVAFAKDGNENALQYLIFSPQAEPVKIEITDLLGRIVFSRKAFDFAGTIDFSGLAHGSYTFRVFNETESVSKKIIY